MMIWIALWLYACGSAVTWDSVEELAKRRTDLGPKRVVVLTFSIFWPIIVPAVALRIAYALVTRK